MGGREKAPEHADREAWIMEVSDTRLERYERMLRSRGADRRLDGTPRVGSMSGLYFADLVQREKVRRGN